MTLPKMAEISNNSRLTQELAEVINNNLSQEDLAKFHRWLQLCGSEMRTFTQNEIKKRRY